MIQQGLDIDRHTLWSDTNDATGCSTPCISRFERFFISTFSQIISSLFHVLAKLQQRLRR
jgi:hypothetical protein